MVWCHHSWKVKAVSICCSAIICSLTCTFAVRGECGSLRRFASHGRAISGMDSSRAADLSECNRKKESNFVSPSCSGRRCVDLKRVELLHTQIMERAARVELKRRQRRDSLLLFNHTLVGSIVRRISREGPDRCGPFFSWCARRSPALWLRLDVTQREAPFSIRSSSQAGLYHREALGSHRRGDRKKKEKRSTERVERY